MKSAPLDFAFAVHLHQPVGNFDHVFQDHVDGVYRPFLDALHERGCYPITLHVSGPLIDWLEGHAPQFLDALGRRVADGHIELLASGKYEPILAALAPVDRVEQIEWMRGDLHARFGVDATGLWLTERVWEPDLAADLARAGIRYTLLDDRHFLAAGLGRDELDRPFSTESGGRSLSVLPIDERLRYLIPFRPVPDILEFLVTRQREGCRQVVLGDDGEKFGGWPNTREWVYDAGWLDEYLTGLDQLREDGRIELVTTGQAAQAPSGGLAYPTPGSYREMEEWTLPRPAALLFEDLRAGSAVRSAGGEDADTSPLVRGGHWKGFLRKYPESNRMHKATLQLSKLCRERGNPVDARDAIGRAQCNDAYWHGVFGGVYLPHLRQGIWRELARAEAMLRTDEGLDFEALDFDLDGYEEIWIHSSEFSALLSPARGGAIEILTRFAAATNDVDVITRRLETYHGDASSAADPSVASRTAPSAEPDGIASVHDRADALPVPPGLDTRTRVLFQERVLALPLAADADTPFIDWSGEPFRIAGEIRIEAGVLHVTLESAGETPPLRKRFAVHAGGEMEVELDWSDAGLSADHSVVCQLSLAHAATLTTVPAAGESRSRIITLVRSERGFEHIDQGESIDLAWPGSAGRATVRLAAERDVGSDPGS